MPIFPENNVILKPNEQKLIKVKVLFVVKILDGGTHSTLFLKLKFTQNKAILDMVNKGANTMIFRLQEMIGIIDLR